MHLVNYTEIDRRAGQPAKGQSAFEKVKVKQGMKTKTRKRLIALLTAVTVLFWLPAAALNEELPEEAVPVVEEQAAEPAEQQQEETPVEAPAAAPAEAPTETVTEAPAEAPAEVPAEIPAEAPTEALAEAPAEAPTEAPAAAPAEALTEETVTTAPEAKTEEKAEEKTEEEKEESAAEKTPAAPALVETTIDGIKITLTVSEGTAPSVRKISDDAMTARVEGSFAPKAEDGQTLRARHLLLKVSGGMEGGKIKVRMEKAGLKKWKQDAGEGAAVNAIVAKVDSAKAEKISAGINWETNEITFDAPADAVVDVFLTAVVTEHTEEKTEESEEAEEKPEQTEETETKEETAEAPAAEELKEEEPEAEGQLAAEEQDAADQPEEPAQADESTQPEEPAATEETGEPEPAEVPAPEPVAFDQSAVVDGVKISVSATPGVFPAGAKLSVRRITAAEQAKVDQAIDRAQDDRTQVAVSYSFDITILDESGNELQPADGQTVNVSFSLAEVADTNLQTTVYHMEEQADGTLNAEKLNTQETGETVTAESDGFSTYTLTLTYEARSFSVIANSSIAVSELTGAVGLAGTPTAATLAAAEAGKGVSLTGSSPNWTVSAAAQAASAEQTLVVTLNNVDFNILLSVFEQQQETTPLDYLDEKGVTQTWTGGYADVKSSTWQAAGGFSGWWAVDGEVVLEQRVMVYGDVKLVLRDGCSLKANGGIQVSPGSSLTIYSQGKKTGALTAASREPDGNARATGAAIGGAYSTAGKGNAGTINIIGGVITATSGAPGCAGIGGGTDGTATVTIAGGTVNATGNGNGAGIGGIKDGTKVTVSGGSVTAKGGNDGGVAITGREGTTATLQNGAAEEERDPNLTYAPDGTVYDPSTPEVDRTGTFASSATDPFANLRREYYNADLEKLYTPVRTPRHTTSATNLQQTGPGSQGTVEEQLKGKNVILITVNGAHDGSEVFPILNNWGITYSNHPADQAGSEEDILLTGMPENGTGTAAELIASFGFAPVPDGVLSKETSGPMAVTNEQAVLEALNWILTDGSSLNAENKPFFMSLQLNGGQAEKAGPVTAIPPEKQNKEKMQGKQDKPSAKNDHLPQGMPGHEGPAGKRDTAASQAAEADSNGPAGPWDTGVGQTEETESAGPAGPWETGSNQAEDTQSAGPAGPWDTGAGQTEDTQSVSPAGPWDTGSSQAENIESNGPAGPWDTGVDQAENTELTGPALPGEAAVYQAGPGGVGAATQTDLEAADVQAPEPGSTRDIDECLTMLIDTIRQNGLLGRTVIILLDRADHQTIIIHPDLAGGTVIAEETADRDILATILALGVRDNGVTLPLPAGLKGKDLLSLVGSADVQQ